MVRLIATVVRLPIIVAACFVAVRGEAQDITRLGGDLTTDLTGHNALQVAAPNTTSQERFERQISGFDVFHRKHTEDQGLGPRFNNSACGGCHVSNGKGPVKVRTGANQGSTVVIKVSLPGLQPDGAPRDVPGVGEQLLDRSLNGRRYFRLRLGWRDVHGTYPDGTRYTLRRPDLQFRISGRNQRKIAHSLRMSPILVGMGLLEAIPEETILALSDPEDLDGDGISGKPMYVPNRRSSGVSIGRFGFRASHPTVEQQSSAAAFHDMGLTNALFPGEEGGTSELSDDDLDRLVIYQMIPGVPKARNQDDPQVVEGKAIFQQISCHSCHVMTVQIGASAVPELANQTIHPFTDLLLHNMGPGLADKRAEFSARGSEWRTTPLWGLGFASTVSSVRPNYLHDGRARTIEEAILWHGGEAQKSQRQFKSLSRAKREALIKFLRSL